MRNSQIFAGSSHPALVDGICNRLGQTPGKAELGKFANGETSVSIQTSIRDKHVFIVQSGSGSVNDSVIELLVMISACKGGSARSITAVMPYFPYARQSKKKTQRGAITAKLIADLLGVAGVNHVITIDLHASQMQGFFKCPVDNLIAEPLLAKWIKVHMPDWNHAVVVSKNPGGTKRATSLADALKISFGIVTTERARPLKPGILSMSESIMYDKTAMDGARDDYIISPLDRDIDSLHITPPVMPNSNAIVEKPAVERQEQQEQEADRSRGSPKRNNAGSNAHNRRRNGTLDNALPGSPLHRSTRADSVPQVEAVPSPARFDTAELPWIAKTPDDADEQEEDTYVDERAQNVVHGRLVRGHVVDDAFPSPSMSAVSGGTAGTRNRVPSDDEEPPDHMTQSFMSVASSRRSRAGTMDGALGGSGDAANSSEDEEEDLTNPDFDGHATLVGDVRNKPVLIIDDIIDKAASWIAAAEVVVKRGGATKVSCLATHGLFGGDSLQDLEDCDVIDKIIVTDAFPIPEDVARRSRKLKILTVDALLAEAIRRNHHGESISALFMHHD